MRLTRRQAMIGGTALGAAAVGAGLYADGKGGIADHAIQVIRAAYGPEIAAEPAAREFAEEYDRFVRAKGLQGRAVNALYRMSLEGMPVVRSKLEAIDQSIISKFATSTNVIMAYETGEPLVFVALFQPYTNACVNQLSAHAIS